jgi:excisionase family DNA binding protein
MVQNAYTVDEFAQRNRVSRATIYREVADGRLRLLKIRNRTLIAADEEKRWLAEAMQSAS